MTNSKNKRNERGQTLPIALIMFTAQLAMIGAFCGVGIYAQWHIRAQTAADNAARTLASIQAFQFNRIELIILAGSMEEYRLRSLMNGAIISAHGKVDPIVKTKFVAS